MAEFDIPSHPLYDLYFLQIYHAQSIGIAASPLLKRVLILFGRKMSAALGRWVGETDPRAINLDTRERYVESLKWFFNDYIYDHLLEVAIDGTLGIGISFITAGTPTISVLSAVDVLKKGVIDPIVKSPYLKKEDRELLLGVVFTLFFICLCVVLILRKPWETLVLPFGAQSQAQVLLPNQTQVVFTAESLVPTLTATVRPVTPIPVMETSTSSALIYSDVGYCLYVVQPSDTLQSVAIRFKVTENDIRASDKLVGWGAFTTNQMIRINSSCCRPANVNGYSYTVQRGETLYSIARNNSVSVAVLASVNNLYSSGYIQAGQMLCIPYT